MLDVNIFRYRRKIFFKKIVLKSWVFEDKRAVRSSRNGRLSCHRISHTTDLRLMGGSSRVTRLIAIAGGFLTLFDFVVYVLQLTIIV